MNEASRWRLELARKVAPRIAANPKVRGVMVGGSVSRGSADSYSDIEIGAFWESPPTDEERVAPARLAGGEFWQLDSFDPEEQIWVEEWGLNGVKMDMRNMTVEGFERVMADVLERHETAEVKQAILSAILHCIPLHNAPLFEAWKARLAHYPDELARAMVRQNLDYGIWKWWVSTLIARDDVILVAESFSIIGKQVLGVLVGLNRIYHPGLKWSDRLIAELTIAPPDLSPRLKKIFRNLSFEARDEMLELLLEVYALVEKHMPEVDTSKSRRDLLYWREEFHAPPLL